MHEGIPILNYLVPKEFTHADGRLTGSPVRGSRRSLDETVDATSFPAESPTFTWSATMCSSLSARRMPFRGSSGTSASSSTAGTSEGGQDDFQSTLPNVFFGGDAAFGPKNIIWAVAHGHEAAISIDRYCRSESLLDRPPPTVNLVSQKMGIHEWSDDNETCLDLRYKVPLREQAIALKDVKAEVELGFDRALAYAETQRCLNCDVQTVFARDLCIECDVCTDICPMDCITFTTNGPEEALRSRLTASAVNLSQDLYVSGTLKTGRVMVKDEDVCLHCGLCAERCPTGAWDMQKFLLDMAHAYETKTCQSRA